MADIEGIAVEDVVVLGLADEEAVGAPDGEAAAPAAAAEAEMDWIYGKREAPVAVGETVSPGTQAVSSPARAKMDITDITSKRLLRYRVFILILSS
jgi:hypothetical protein